MLSRNPSGLASSGVMSRNTRPGRGKSWMVRMYSLSRVTWKLVISSLHGCGGLLLGVADEFVAIDATQRQLRKRHRCAIDVFFVRLSHQVVIGEAENPQL